MKHKIFFIIILSGIILDQAVKYLVSTKLALGSGPAVIKGLFSITYIQNTGAAFGMFHGNNTLFIIVSLCFIALLLVYVLIYLKGDAFADIPFAIIIAGATGNLLDRILRGYVIDFFDLRYFSVFNTADLMINIGVALLLIDILFRGKRKGRA